MKAITIIQPWATLLAAGYKNYETRSWNTNYRGEIMLHAGKKDPKWGCSIMGEEAFQTMMRIMSLQENGFNRLKVFPTGAIVGKATLTDCILLTEEIVQSINEQYPEEILFGDFTPGRYAWKMENPVLFEKPIIAAGKQGLWNYEEQEEHKMNGRELSSKLNYLGMERAVRKLALDDKMATAEQIAVMSEVEVCDLIMQKYEIVFSESEDIGLVAKEDMEEYNKLVKLISR